jgi:hypothetical protein
MRQEYAYYEEKQAVVRERGGEPKASFSSAMETGNAFKE